MLEFKKSSDFIYNVENKIINTLLTSLTFLGLLVIIFNFIKAERFHDWTMFYIMNSVIVFLVFTTIFKRKIKKQTKALVLIVVVLFYFLFSLSRNGIMAGSIILVAMIPALSSYILDIRKAIIVLTLIMFTYGIFGFMFVHGHLNYRFNPHLYINNSAVWILHGLALLASSSGLLYFIVYYKNTLKGKIEKYYALINNSNDAIILFENGIITECNLATQEMFQ